MAEHRKMDEIDLAGLNHVRHELEECAKVTELNIDKVVSFYIAMTAKPLNVTEAAKGMRKIFAKLS